MESDKQIELLMDAEDDGGSNCCDATIYNGICSDCKEPCGYASEDEVEEIPQFKGTLEALNNLTIKK